MFLVLCQASCTHSINHILEAFFYSSHLFSSP